MVDADGAILSSTMSFSAAGDDLQAATSRQALHSVCRTIVNIRTIPVKKFHLLGAKPPRTVGFPGTFHMMLSLRRLLVLVVTKIFYRLSTFSCLAHFGFLYIILPALLYGCVASLIAQPVLIGMILRKPLLRGHAVQFHGALHSTASEVYLPTKVSLEFLQLT